MIKVILLIVGALLLGFLLVTSSPVDSMVAQLPYNVSTHQFYGEIHLWCKIIYAVIPILVWLIISACVLLLVFYSWFGSHALKIKRFAIVTLLSLALGPGLIANSIFKDYWGRPRPYQVLRDHQSFRAFYQPQLGSKQFNSFPSGHATIGFFLGVPLLVLRRRKVGLVVSLGAGSITGLVRILQGGHYLSDVLFSGIIVWGSAELVTYIYDKFFRRAAI